MVPESAPAEVSLRLQWRRLFDAQLYPDFGDDDPGTRGGAVAARRSAEDPDEALGNGRSSGDCGGRVVAFHRDLPGSEAHLDSQLDAVQWRAVLPFPGGILLANGGARLSAMGIPV